MSLIELRGASVWLESTRILKNLNWTLEPGAHFAVLGGNGAGKSTFLRLLAGQIWPRPHDSRHYEIGGARTWSPLRARENIALLSPEIQERFVRHLQDGPDNEKGWQLDTRAAVLAGFFGSELLHQQPTRKQEKRADGTIAQLGLSHLASRPLQTLSQGQMRRVLLARALVSDPAVLLLDEACSGLDAASREEMLELIEKIASSGLTTLGMTTHRESEIVPSISSVVTMRDGEIWDEEKGNGSDSNHFPAFEAAKAPANAPLVNSSETLIQLENASVFLDGTPVLQGLNWELKRGQHFAVEGGNGAGKTTFMRLLRGELHPSLGGKITRFGASRMTRAAIGAKISLLSPSLQARYNEQISVETAVASGFFDSFGLPGSLSQEMQNRTAAIMAQCGLNALATRDFTKLSYGQRRRVLLARALVTDPQILLLDEALDGLDSASRGEWNALLADVAARGTSLVVTSHHRSDYPPFLTDLLTLEHGRILAHVPFSP
jgi:molybdate transport system ATP-binding protein